VEGILIDEASLEQISGGFTHIYASYNAQGDFHVVVTEKGVKMEDYYVKGTTRAQKSPRTGEPGYTPVPLPCGTHKLSTVLYNGKIVTGYHIDVTVPTVVNGKIVDMNDYFIHATTSFYTFGCAGIRSDWDRFEDTMAAEREGAVITIHNRRD